MVKIPGTNGFEYDIEIDCSGSILTVSNGDFVIEGAFIHEMADQEIPNIQIDVSLNTATKELKIMNPIRLKVRENSSDAWLIRFTGFIEQLAFNSKQNKITITAVGREILLKARTIAFKQYGATYIEEEELLAAVAGANNYSYVYSMVDGPLNLPLSDFRIHNGHGGLQAGDGSGADVLIYNDGLLASRELVIPFRHNGGRLFGFCIKCDKDASCDVDLVCTIEGISDWNDMGPDGNVLLSGNLSNDLVTSMGWYRIPFTDQDTQLPAGWYDAHFKQYVGDVSSTLLNPFWQLKTVILPNEPVAPSLWNTDGGGWVANDPFGAGVCPFYLPDSEFNYINLEYPSDYICPYSNTILVNMGDIDNGSSYGKDIVADGLTDMKLTRASYWYGTMVFNDAIEDFLQDFCGDLVDAISVSVSNPVVDIPNITIKEMSIWEGLLEFRKHAPITWRIDEELSGTTTLYVNDKIGIDSWAGASDDYKTWHTFKHGHDDSSNDDFVCIANDTLTKKLNNLANRIFIYNELGDAVYGDREDADLIGSFELDAGIRFPGANQHNMFNLANAMAGELRTVVIQGDVELTDFSLNSTKQIFRSHNELINIVDSNTGFNGQYAINRISVDYSNGATIRVEITDTVKKYFIPAVNGYIGVGNVVVGFFKHKGDWVVDDSLVTCPNPGGLPRSNDVLYLKGTDFGPVFYDPSSTYIIELGKGAPAAGDLGDPVATSVPTIEAHPDEGTTYLIAKFGLSSRIDELKGIAPTISEVCLVVDGVHYPRSIGTARTGVGDIAKAQPKMQMSTGLVTIIIKLTNAP